MNDGVDLLIFSYTIGSSGSLDDPLAPPKPSRQPSVDNKTDMPVSTYIVAQNAEVLAHLLKENEQRGVNPSVYTTPATGFNTITVDFLNDIDDDKTISAGNSILSMDSVGLISMDSGSGGGTSQPSTNKTLPRNFTSGAASLTLPNMTDKRRCSDGSLGTCTTGGGINNEVQLALLWSSKLHDCSFIILFYLYFVFLLLWTIFFQHSSVSNF